MRNILQSLHKKDQKKHPVLQMETDQTLVDDRRRRWKDESGTLNSYSLQLRWTETHLRTNNTPKLYGKNCQETRLHNVTVMMFQEYSSSSSPSSITKSFGRASLKRFCKIFLHNKPRWSRCLLSRTTCAVKLRRWKLSTAPETGSFP